MKEEGRMRKKIVLGVLIAVVLITAIAGPAIAAWVGSLRAETDIREPISITDGVVEIPGWVYPGQKFEFGGEFHNEAPLTYGLRYYGYLIFYYKAEEEIKIPLESIEESGAVNFSTKAGGLQYFGTVSIDINGEAYSPGSIKNIGPGETHKIRVIVVPSKDIETGHLVAEVIALREAPI